MNTNTPPEQAPTQAPTNSIAKQPLSVEDKKVVYKVQEHISDTGRYSNFLKEMSLPYAAGKGVSEQAAKDCIDQNFEQEMGVNIQGYLEAHREERGLSNDIGNAR
ncbi:MAG: hypothetical protein ACSHX0_13305 [Akkermansiaceae bacterium]